MQSWQDLHTACMGCKKCALWETRTNVVFGVGNKEAEVMLVGEGPGQQEDLTGEPFVGRAGLLLDDMLAMIGLDRRHVYIANIVKCRPPGNRDPLHAEQEACFDWLRAQVSMIKPKLIVCLGRIAATALIRDDFKITKEHGQWFDKDGYRIMAIYHPSALLRDQTKRPETFADLKLLQRTIRELCPATPCDPLII